MSPLNPWIAVVTTEDEAVLREGIRRYFPAADGPTLAMKVCMFANTPDGHFVIDHYPGADHVVIAARIFRTWASSFVASLAKSPSIWRPSRHEMGCGVIPDAKTDGRVTLRT
jgi:hypothetical protein